MWDVTRLLLQKRHDNVLEDISNFSNDLTSLQMESVIGTNKYHQISSSIHILAPPVTSCCRSSPCSPPSASPKSARSRLDDFLGQAGFRRSPNSRPPMGWGTRRCRWRRWRLHPKRRVKSWWKKHSWRLAHNHTDPVSWGGFSRGSIYQNIEGVGKKWTPLFSPLFRGYT